MYKHIKHYSNEGTFSVKNGGGGRGNTEKQVCIISHVGFNFTSNDSTNLA